VIHSWKDSQYGMVYGTDFLSVTVFTGSIWGRKEISSENPSYL